MLAFKSLERRLIVLLALPLTLFLLVIGYSATGSFRTVIQGMAGDRHPAPGAGRPPVGHASPCADAMDGDLRPAGQDPRGQEIQRWLLQQIQSQPGVSQVNLSWEKPAEIKGSMSVADRSVIMSPLGYFYPSDAKTVGLRGSSWIGPERRWAGWK